MKTKADALEAQKEYCRENGHPNFAGSGHCFNCKRDIYDVISFDHAATQLITGCPHCHYSFVE